MSIIACPACGKKISEFSPLCSHCGFQRSEASEEQVKVFRQRQARDRVYRLKMSSYGVLTVFLAAFGWYWWDSGGFLHPPAVGPVALMGLSAVAYLLVRILLYRAQRQYRSLIRAGAGRMTLR